MEKESGRGKRKREGRERERERERACGKTFHYFNESIIIYFCE